MTGRRAGGRRARAEARAAGAREGFDPEWRQWINPYRPVEQFSEDEIEAIHQASLDILRDTGVRVLNDEAQIGRRRVGKELPSV